MATGGQGGQSAPDSETFAKKLGKKREKIRKNWDGFCTLPLLTDKAGYYATGN